MKKKTLAVAAALMLTVGLAMQTHGIWPAKAVAAMPSSGKQAEIQFDTLRIDLGTFSEKDGLQSCAFTFTNVGEAPLILNQVFASCGCTVPVYTKDPVKPGEKGRIDVTYNGKGKQPGHMTKTITVRSNAKTQLVRLTIEGTMTK